MNSFNGFLTKASLILLCLFSATAHAVPPVVQTTISVESTGTGPFDSDTWDGGGIPGAGTNNLAGLDENASNDVVRLQDTVTYRVETSVNDSHVDDLITTVELGPLQAFVGIPTGCVIDPADFVNGPASNISVDGRTLECNLGPAIEGTNRVFFPIARAIGASDDGTVIAENNDTIFANVSGTADPTTNPPVQPGVDGPTRVVITGFFGVNLLKELNSTAVDDFGNSQYIAPARTGDPSEGSRDGLLIEYVIRAEYAQGSVIADGANEAAGDFTASYTIFDYYTDDNNNNNAAFSTGGELYTWDTAQPACSLIGNHGPTATVTCTQVDVPRDDIGAAGTAPDMLNDRNIIVVVSGVDVRDPEGDGNLFEVELNIWFDEENDVDNHQNGDRLLFTSNAVGTLVDPAAPSVSVDPSTVANPSALILDGFNPMSTEQGGVNLTNFNEDPLVVGDGPPPPPPVNYLLEAPPMPGGSTARKSFGGFNQMLKTGAEQDIAPGDIAIFGIHHSGALFINENTEGQICDKIDTSVWEYRGLTPDFVTAGIFADLNGVTNPAVRITRPSPAPTLLRDAGVGEDHISFLFSDRPYVADPVTAQAAYLLELRNATCNDDAKGDGQVVIQQANGDFIDGDGNLLGTVAGGFAPAEIDWWENPNDVPGGIGNTTLLRQTFIPILDDLFAIEPVITSLSASSSHMIQLRGNVLTSPYGTNERIPNYLSRRQANLGATPDLDLVAWQNGGSTDPSIDATFGNDSLLTDRMTIVQTTTALTKGTVPANIRLVSPGDAVDFILQPGVFGRWSTDLIPTAEARLADNLPPQSTYVGGSEMFSVDGGVTFVDRATYDANFAAGIPGFGVNIASAANSPGQDPLVWEFDDIESISTANALTQNEQLPIITYTVIVDPLFVSGTFRNTARLSSDDIGDGDIIARHTLEVVPSFGMQVSKSVDFPVFETNEPFTFDLSYTNLGGEDYANFEFIDILPFNTDGAGMFGGVDADRDPPSDFSGTFELTELIGGNGEMFYATVTPSANISIDPCHSSNQPFNGAAAVPVAGDLCFSTFTNNGGQFPDDIFNGTGAAAGTGATVWVACTSLTAPVTCGALDPNDITAIRMVVPSLTAGTPGQEVNIELTPTGNVGGEPNLVNDEVTAVSAAAANIGDVYTNSYGGRVAEISLPIIAKDVSVTIVSGSIGDTVWFDADSDGEGPAGANNGADPGESVLPGVSVALLDSNGNPVFQDPVTGGIVTSTTPNAVPYVDVTDANGMYLFENLPSGVYTVVVTPPTGFVQTFDDDGLATPNQSTHNLLAEFDEFGQLTGVEDDRDQDFGYVIAASIGSYVWNDLNIDGLQGPTEPGVAGALVELFVFDTGTNTFVPAVDLMGNPVPSQTTLATGLYFFSSLPFGDYQVQVTPPAGFDPTINQNPADDNALLDTNIATGAAGVYRSGTVNLALNAEVTEAGSAAGDTQDDSVVSPLVETNGNMTIDFGFFVPDPELGVSKAAGAPTLNDDGTFDVPYTLLIQNTGNVDITNLSLADDLETQFTSTLFTGSDATVTTGGIVSAPTVSVITDATVAGTANVVLPTANAAYTGAPGGDALFAASPLSALGVDDVIQVTFGAGGPGTPTPVVLPLLEPELGVSKAAGTPIINADGTFDVPYTLQIQNTGNVDITDLSLADDLETQFTSTLFTGSDATVTTGGIVVAPSVSTITDATGTAVVLPTANAVYTGAPGGDALFAASPLSTLGVGDVIEVTFTVRLNTAAAGQTLNNTATAGGSDPSGDPVTDDSNNGADPTDGAGGPGTPTPVVLPLLEPELGVSKAAGTAILNADGTFDVPYTMQIQNTGNVDITDITLADDLETQFGVALFTGSDATVATGGIVVAPAVSLITDATGTAVVLPTANAAYTGAPGGDALFAASPLSTLGVDDVIEVTFTVRLNSAAAGQTLTNTATAGGTDPSGEPVTDDSNDGADPTDGAGGPGVPTVVTLPVGEPSLIISKALALPPQDLGNGSFLITYSMVIENDGNVDMTDLQVVDDLAATINDPVPNNGVVGPATVSFVSGTPLSPNPAYTGTGINDMLLGTDPFPVGSVSTIELSFEFTPDDYLGHFNNTSTVSGTDPQGNTEVDNSVDGAVPSSTADGSDETSPTLFTLLAPTVPISLGSFDGTLVTDGVLLTWVTQTEVANIGFNLYAQIDGEWIALNDQIIPSQGDSVSLQNYEFLYLFSGDPSALVFSLGDIDVQGDETLHGPFRMGEAQGVIGGRRDIDWRAERSERETKAANRKARRANNLRQRLQNNKKERRERRARNRSEDTSMLDIFTQSMSSLVASALVAIIPSAHAQQGTAWVNLATTEAGVHEISYAELTAFGADLEGFTARNMSLTNQGQTIPVQVLGGTAFGPGSSIRFIAESIDTIYTDRNIYTLSTGARPSVAISEAPTEISARAPFATSYLATAKFAPQSAYSFISPDESDPWFATRLARSTQPVSDSVIVQLENVAVGGNTGATQAKMSVNVWGASDLPGINDHRMQVSFNGRQLMDERFDALSSKTFSMELDDVFEGSNEVTLTLPTQSGFGIDVVNVNEIEVDYPRQFIAEDNRLSFSSGLSKFWVRGFTPNTTDQNGDPSLDVVVLREDPDGNVEEVNNAQVRCTQECSVVFGGTGAVANYYVSANRYAVTPQTLVVEQNITSGQANYLIISHPDFIGGAGGNQLEQLAVQLTSELGSADVVDVEQIYAQFSGHVFDPTAIQRYIQFAQANRGTEYVLLVGGDVYDYRQFENEDATSFIPSLYAATGNNVTFAPVDAKYVDINNDNVPDLPIGRLPVRTTAQLTNLLSKRQAYVDRDYAGTALIVADEFDEIQQYDFTNDAQAIADSYLGNFDVNRAFVDEVGSREVRTRVTSSINQGTTLTSFFGHSSTNQWSFDGLLTGNDAASLSNVGRPTVVTQWGCWNTYYVNPSEDSMGQRFMVEGAQGAIAVMGATTLTNASSERALADLVFARLANGERLGDAITSAKQQYAQTNPDDLDVLLGWTLLGLPELLVN